MEEEDAVHGFSDGILSSEREGEVGETTTDPCPVELILWSGRGRGRGRGEGVLEGVKGGGREAESGKGERGREEGGEREEGEARGSGRTGERGKGGKGENVTVKHMAFTHLMQTSFRCKSYLDYSCCFNEGNSIFVVLLNACCDG